MSGDYRVKRAYDAVSEADGKRVLVDRLWPRGVSREEAELDLWAKDATPSNDLRKWLHANRDEYAEFVARYDVELEGATQKAALAEVRRLHDAHTVTLITAAKDVDHSHVPVLIKHLEEGA
ncbi:DUF488 domain-containing protein [Catenulispora pinisilvae]|uniref:DUF488 domain-containing protein n=1 Tax=Catenulispora pinisilvae TaxID=2705253 RepID=UPI00189255C2|nr:DUF488 family protein [Catenulispora pinisilvae]